MSNPFAILADYPQEGPAVPAREKTVRAKDHHESGTGRRDKTKREGRGAGNWGNAKDDLKVNKKAEKIENEANAEEPAEEKVEEEKPKIQYVNPSQFFMDDEDEEEKPVKKQPKESNMDIAQKYLDIMTKKAQEKKVHEREEKQDETIILDTAFLSTEEALKQRRERAQTERRFNGPRRDRAPRKQGEKPARKFAEKPRKEGEAPKPAAEKPRNERKPRDDRKPRDQRNSGVQHQRQNAGKNLALNAKNFPSL